MGYGVYEDDNARGLGLLRWAGYEVPGTCDATGCEYPLALGRGIANRCESEWVDDGLFKDSGCGFFFCGEHLSVGCNHRAVTAKPDLPEWEEHILTDDSWAQWRRENPARVAEMKARVTQ